MRAGVSGSPDQFFFGGHVETRPLADRLRFRPNVEIGVGDAITLVALNLEFAYAFRPGRSPWRAYIGAGPAAVIASSHHDRGGDTTVGGGFNVLVGAQHREGLFGELKVGFVDSPELKVTVGYVFR